MTGILLCYVLLCLPVFSQDGKKEGLVIKTEKSIDIDGLLNESIWEKAPDASVFIQKDPYEEDTDNFKTVVKILYDDDSVYFGFLCYDPDPEKIHSDTIMIDGDLRDTNSMYILIDTFDDPVNFYYFSINFLGAKSDGKISKNGQTASYKWDGDWKAFGQKTDFGWSAEVAIERGCIFEEPVESKTLGLSLARIVPRLGSTFYSGPLDPPFDFGQIGPLQELDLVGLEIGASIHPYVITRVESGAKTEPGAGIDAKYAFSQQASGRLVIYPDFATVEPDEERVNLTPFELYLPEKRDFFLEGSGDYQQPLGLFYSKRVGDIYAGVKLQGRAGAFAFSGMSAQAKKQEDLGEGSANFSVFSLEKKGIAGSTSFGFIAANKFIDNQNIGTAGMYSDLPITGNLKLSGQFALSYGDHNKGNIAFFLGPSYDSKTFHIHLHYIQIGENFGDNVNHVGFIPDDNRRELDSAINMTFPFKEGLLSQVRYVSNYNIYWGMDDTLRSWRIDEGLLFYLKNKFILSAIYTQEYKLNEFFPEPRLIYIQGEGYNIYPGPGPAPKWIGTPGRWEEVYIKDFRNHRITFTSSYNASTWKSFGLDIAVGRNFDSPFQMIAFHKKLKLTEKLFSEYDVYFLKYDDEFYFKSTTILVLKLACYANRNLSWRLFFQSNSAISKSNFHIVCTYKLKPPFGSIQLIYQKGTAGFGLKGTQDHTLFFKYSHMF